MGLVWLPSRVKMEPRVKLLVRSIEAERLKPVVLTVRSVTETWRLLKAGKTRVALAIVIRGESPGVSVRAGSWVVPVAVTVSRLPIERVNPVAVKLSCPGLVELARA